MSKIEKAGNSQICTFQLPEGIQANNGCVLRVQMKSSNGKIAGTVCVKWTYKFSWEKPLSLYKTV